MYDFYVLSWFGGEYEDSYSAERVYVSRKNAESAFEKFVADAKDLVSCFEADVVEMREACLDESGAIMPTKLVRSWNRYEED